MVVHLLAGRAWLLLDRLGCSHNLLLVLLIHFGFQILDSGLGLVAQFHKSRLRLDLVDVLLDLPLLHLLLELLLLPHSFLLVLMQGPFDAKLQVREGQLFRP